MRISDWSSDVCSSDLHLVCQARRQRHGVALSVSANGRAGCSAGAGQSIEVSVQLAIHAASLESPVPRPADVQSRRIEISGVRSEEHTSELQSLMRISYAVFCLKKKKNKTTRHTNTQKLNTTKPN